MKSCHLKGQHLQASKIVRNIARGSEWDNSEDECDTMSKNEDGTSFDIGIGGGDQG